MSTTCSLGVYNMTGKLSDRRPCIRQLTTSFLDTWEHKSLIIDSLSSRATNWRLLLSISWLRSNSSLQTALVKPVGLVFWLYMGLVGCWPTELRGAWEKGGTNERKGDASKVWIRSTNGGGRASLVKLHASKKEEPSHNTDWKPALPLFRKWNGAQRFRVI